MRDAKMVPLVGVSPPVAALHRSVAGSRAQEEADFQQEAQSPALEATKSESGSAIKVLSDVGQTRARMQHK